MCDVTHSKSAMRPLLRFCQLLQSLGDKKALSNTEVPPILMKAASQLEPHEYGTRPGRVRLASSSTICFWNFPQDGGD